MPLKNIIAWQPLLTDHQAYTFKALEVLSGRKLIAFIIETENSIRKSQGWAETKVVSVDKVLIPQKHFLFFCFNVLLKHRHDIHIFSSPFQETKLIICLFIARFLGCKFYLTSEPYSPIKDGYLEDGDPYLNAFKSHVRPFLYRFYSICFRGGIAGIFAISKLAYSQYLGHGIPKEKLFPFGYFIPQNTQLIPPIKPQWKCGSPLKIIYVGALIRRKGLDLLQDAVCSLRKNLYQVSLDIYGAGDEDLILSNLDFISYKGVIPFGEAQEFISHYDLLVLPSRYDGWGVVINEALCANVPVVFAHSVGAGEVAKNFGAGLSFSGGNSKSLAIVLKGLMDDPNLLNTLRNNTRIAAESLQPEVAAKYMRDIISMNGVACRSVQSPWYF